MSIAPAFVMLDASVATELITPQPWMFSVTVWPAAIVEPLIVFGPPSPRRSKLLAPDPVKCSVTAPLINTGFPEVVIEALVTADDD